MFTFEDLLGVPEAGIRELLGQMDKKTLATALRGASEELKNYIFKSMSSRAVEMLKEDMEVLGPVRSREVTQAQLEAVAVARKLEAEGKLVLSAEARRSMSSSRPAPTRAMYRYRRFPCLGSEPDPLERHSIYAEAQAPGPTRIRLLRLSEQDVADAAAAEAAVFARRLEAGEQQIRRVLEDFLMRNSGTQILRGPCGTSSTGKRALIPRRSKAEVVQLALAVARKILDRAAQIDSLCWPASCARRWTSWVPAPRKSIFSFRPAKRPSGAKRFAGREAHRPRGSRRCFAGRGRVCASKLPAGNDRDLPATQLKESGTLLFRSARRSGPALTANAGSRAKIGFRIHAPEARSWIARRMTALFCLLLALAARRRIAPALARARRPGGWAGHGIGGPFCSVGEACGIAIPAALRTRERSSASAARWYFPCCWRHCRRALRRPYRERWPAALDGVSPAMLGCVIDGAGRPLEDGKRLPPGGEPAAGWSAHFAAGEDAHSPAAWMRRAGH